MAYLPDWTQPRAMQLTTAIDTLMEMKLDRSRAQEQRIACVRHNAALGAALDEEYFSDPSYFELLVNILERREEEVFEFIVITLTDLGV
jgi:hypothetical protein